ncbi:hypothetical protein [Vacuolonema iberomarrocanum]|uniref:hypothetical protein n=1 Tax=Vacuolonema iberomarrocanum TaxID=3454632 RepID=UPI0019D8872E|nr:hypothetical protein [filamentous cyanobacterium LEGE 07170]
MSPILIALFARSLPLLSIFSMLLVYWSFSENDTVAIATQNWMAGAKASLSTPVLAPNPSLALASQTAEHHPLEQTLV